MGLFPRLLEPTLIEVGIFSAEGFAFSLIVTLFEPPLLNFCFESINLALLLPATFTIIDSIIFTFWCLITHHFFTRLNLPVFLDFFLRYYGGFL